MQRGGPLLHSSRQGNYVRHRLARPGQHHAGLFRRRLEHRLEARGLSRKSDGFHF